MLVVGAFATEIYAATPSASPRISREEYVNRYGDIAISHQQRYGIPASITMAQGILESDCGNSRLAKSSNNHFGIKCKGGWTGRSVRHDDDAPNECFRAYKTVEESYQDHAEFLDNSPRYDSLFRFDPTDYRSWARGLKGAGYATAPDYTERLIKIIEESQLYLLDENATNPNYHPAFGFTPRPQQASSERRAVGAGVDPNNFTIAVSSSSGHSLYSTNGVTYVIAGEGDSYTSLGRSLGVSGSALLRNNDISDRGAELRSGDVVYIERKGRAWQGNVREHMLLEGETLHSVSQSYGIRMSSLRRLNRLKKEEEPTVGTPLRLQ